MFEMIRRFLTPAEGPTPDAGRAMHVAAALLVEVAASDQDQDEREARRIEQTLREEFAITQAEAADLVKAARAARSEGPDLQRLSAELVTHCDPDTRRRLVEAMWSVVYADGRVDAVESRLASAMVHLFQLPEHDLIEARKAAETAAQSA